MRISDWSSDVCSSDLEVIIVRASIAIIRSGGIRGHVRSFARAAPTKRARSAASSVLIRSGSAPITSPTSDMMQSDRQSILISKAQVGERKLLDGSATHQPHAPLDFASLLFYRDRKGVW